MIGSLKRRQAMLAMAGGLGVASQAGIMLGFTGGGNEDERRTPGLPLLVITGAHHSAAPFARGVEASVNAGAEVRQAAIDPLSDPAGVRELLASFPATVGLLDDAAFLVVEALARDLGMRCLCEGVHRLGFDGTSHHTFAPQSRASGVSIPLAQALAASGRAHAVVEQPRTDTPRRIGGLAPPTPPSPDWTCTLGQSLADLAMGRHAPTAPYRRVIKGLSARPAGMVLRSFVYRAD